MKTKELLLPFIVVFVLILSTSGLTPWNRITGKGKIVTVSRKVTNFTSVDLRTGANVEITKGTAFHVSVSDYENLVQYLSVKVENNCLIIQDESNKFSFNNSKAKVSITMPDPLYSLKLAGSGNMNVHSAFNDLQSLKITGSGNIELERALQLNKLDVQLVGSGNVNAKGTVRDLYAKISGSGDIHFSQLRAKNGNCSLSGSGNMDLAVEDKLDASLSGSGEIAYSGNAVVHSHVSGSGRIYKK